MITEEFIIWGIPPGKSSEEVLFTQAKSVREAKKVIKKLTDKHQVSEARIQVLDLAENPSGFWKSDKMLNI